MAKSCCSQTINFTDKLIFMKKHYTLATTVATLLISISLFAQDMVPKMPVYEIFSSSTCPPCRPANEHLTPLFEHYKGELAIVKYQVNWPGAGDPYFTSEVGSRRSSYSVNSVPSVFRNAEGILATNFD
ncbi:MAG: thioredoxin family protein, partial [Salibacteraceae bacterium]